MLRAIRRGKFGLVEDPTGQIVTWTVAGRTMLADVVGVYAREFPPAIMLKVRHFNGEPAPDVNSGAVKLVLVD